MAINALFSADDVILGLSATSKRQLFEILAAEVSRHGGPAEEEALEALTAREKLGSTGLGKGVGLPHAELKSASRPVMLFARLEEAIDFDAPDDEPVELWPESSNKEFLTTISTLCGVLRDPKTLKRLRKAETAEEIVGIVHEECQPESKSDEQGQQ